MIGVLHKGNLSECVVCDPTKKEKERRRQRQPKAAMTLELYVRRQCAAELGEDEPTKDQRFILLQKYGVTEPRIDRQVKKPNWMGVSEWKRKVNDWYKATKGLVPQTQPRRYPQSNSPRGQSPQSPSGFRTRKWSEIKHKSGNRPRGTNNFRPNSGPAKTGNNPN